MDQDFEQPITTLLRRAKRGEDGAADHLAAAVEPQLRRMAELKLRQTPDSVLDSVALLNEAWVRMCGTGVRDYVDRAHFLRAASRTMRSILVDRARARAALKRGGGATRLPLEEGELGVEPVVEDLLMLDDLIGGLPAQDAELVELRVFGGLSCADISVVQGCTKRTVERRWSRVSTSLRERLEG